MTTNPRYANGSRRRNLRRRLLATQTHCAWEHCPWPTEPFDTTVHYLDPKAPEVDELIPISLGGDPLSRTNTRLLHRSCNQKRGNGTHTRLPAPPPAKPTTSRPW